MRYVDTTREKGGEVLSGFKPVRNEAFTRDDTH